MSTKKGRTTYFFSPLSFVAVFGSEIWVRYPTEMDKNPESGMDKKPGSATLLFMIQVEVLHRVDIHKFRWLSQRTFNVLSTKNANIFLQISGL